MWHYGYLFGPALTVGGGTFAVQRNIVAEHVLGLPRDINVEAGQTWSESRGQRRGLTDPRRDPRQPSSSTRSSFSSSAMFSALAASASWIFVRVTMPSDASNTQWPPSAAGIVRSASPADTTSS